MGSIDRPSMLRLLAPLVLLGSVLQGALLAPAKAHQIESALQYLDGDLQLSSSFSNGEPTQGPLFACSTPMARQDRNWAAPMPRDASASISVAWAMAPLISRWTVVQATATTSNFPFKTAKWI